MRALIVDDEPLARLELRRLLRSHPEISVAGEACDGAETLRLLRESAPDLLFLDIEMPGMNGFELLAQLSGEVPQVIFTTGYNQHALRAFEVNALDYLLKPISPERLARALERLAPTRRLFVSEGDRCWLVRLEDLYLLESEGNYTRLYFGRERPLVRRSLQAFAQQLEASGFFRANRRQLVNLAWFDRAKAAADGALVLTLRGGLQVELSRRRADRLRALLGN